MFRETDGLTVLGCMCYEIEIFFKAVGNSRKTDTKEPANYYIAILV